MGRRWHRTSRRIYCGVFTPCKNSNIESRSQDYATVDEAVISPCRAEPSRDESRIASPRLFPGDSYKHLDDARVGKNHVTASAVTQQFKRFPACQIKGLYDRLKLILEELSVSSREQRAAEGSELEKS
jgi:hypothetical protein